MSWFLYCIASNQKCQVSQNSTGDYNIHSSIYNYRLQEKLKDEMFQVFGDTDRPCTREDLSKLKYLTICIKETLRLYPTVPVITRLTTEEVQIGEVRWVFDQKLQFQGFFFLWKMGIPSQLAVMCVFLSTRSIVIPASILILLSSTRIAFCLNSQWIDIRTPSYLLVQDQEIALVWGIFLIRRTGWIYCNFIFSLIQVNDLLWTKWK